jgi:hypothetical protein
MDVQMPIFTAFFCGLRAWVDVDGSAWKWGESGPCRDRTYDQLIKSGHFLYDRLRCGEVYLS